MATYVSYCAAELVVGQPVRPVWDLYSTMKLLGFLGSLLVLALFLTA